MNSISSDNEVLMQNIKENNEKINDVVKIINNISEKTNVINDIVFQTKLLSFNASVEAARAGEHGKGFAVVAEEVGNLAALSGTAAKEIKEMLSESTSHVSKLVSEANNSVERLMGSAKSKIDEGVIVANQCGEILTDVVGNAQEISSIMSEIQVAAEEQNSGLTNISEAMGLIDEHVQKSEKLAAESDQCIKQLNLEAEGLQVYINSLECLVKKRKSKNKNSKPGNGENNVVGLFKSIKSKVFDKAA
ncbi:methyl-accepting chemotaxis protein [bacterium]|nr:methyl-accepting chemotaxis protein [bacterium]